MPTPANQAHSWPKEAARLPSAPGQSAPASLSRVAHAGDTPSPVSSGGEEPGRGVLEGPSPAEVLASSPQPLPVTRGRQRWGSGKRKRGVSSGSSEVSSEVSSQDVPGLEPRATQPANDLERFAGLLSAWNRVPGESCQRQEGIGKGSSCTVYEGVWEGQRVAVKSYYAVSAGLIHNELGILNRLGSHPNLISIIGWYKFDGTFHIITPRADVNLRGHLAAKPAGLSEVEVVRIAIDILEGLAHMHSKSIVTATSSPTTSSSSRRGARLSPS